jgi:hypothetical protein
MFHYKFMVNRVNDKGLHEKQDGKTIEVDAPNEEIARSLARTKLRDWSPGQQRYHPAELMAPPTVVPDPNPSAADLDKVAEEQKVKAATVPTAQQQAAESLKGKPS